jgi:primosomal protein N' (replication factor Y)
MIRLVVRGPAEKPAQALAEEIGERLRGLVESAGLAARVLGPAPAPISKLRGKYRFQLQAQATDGDGLRQAAKQATADLKPGEDVQWIVDVDPLDML